MIAAESVAGGGGAGRIQSLLRPERNKWHFKRSKDPCHALCTGKDCDLHLNLHMSCNVIQKHCKQRKCNNHLYFLYRLTEPLGCKWVSNDGRCWHTELGLDTPSRNLPKIVFIIGLNESTQCSDLASKQVAALQNLMSEWREHVNAEGKKFYHNSRTRESLWVLPNDVNQQVRLDMTNSAACLCKTFAKHDLLQPFACYCFSPSS